MKKKPNAVTATGSALLARAGILDGRKATTSKRTYALATCQSQAVLWQSRVRWIVDGKYVTSSGVSAGTDMALGLVERLYGKAAAEQKAPQLGQRSRQRPIRNHGREPEPVKTECATIGWHRQLRCTCAERARGPTAWSCP